MIPNSAGVYQHDGRFLGIQSLVKSACLQMAAHLAGIGDVHLTTIGPEEKLHSPALYTSMKMHVPIEDTMDLHSFLPKDIPTVVEEYIFQARQRGLRDVRIIHGRGIGVQRKIVQSILEKHPDVVSFRDEDDRGSTMVQLRE
jgi:dsDNA-specific endonuclease/ATPase MutS2